MRLFCLKSNAALPRVRSNRVSTLLSVLLPGFAALLASGCVSYEGVGLVRQPLGSSVLAKHGAPQSPPSERPAKDPDHKPVSGLIVIGNASAYRKFSERGSQGAWSSYVAFQEEKRNNHAPASTAEEFAQAYSGWTMLKVSGIPLVTACYERVLVPGPLAEGVVFADPMGTFLFQISEDLIAARTNAEGVFVAAERLCARTEPGYSECARRYLKGYFDADTGTMLGARLRPTRTGKRIDPTTYVRIDDSVAASAAN